MDAEAVIFESPVVVRIVAQEKQNGLVMRFLKGPHFTKR